MCACYYFWGSHTQPEFFFNTEKLQSTLYQWESLANTFIIKKSFCISFFVKKKKDIIFEIFENFINCNTVTKFRK